MSTEQQHFDRLLIALDELIEVNTLKECFEVVQQYPELQSKVADMMLDNLIHQKREQEGENEARLLTLLRQILQNIRQSLVTKRNDENGEIPPLDEVIAAWERVSNHAEFAHVDVAFRLEVLNKNANNHLQRYWFANDLRELERAIAALQEAVALNRQHLPNSPNLPKLLNNLGTGLDSYYNHTGEIKDLERGIEAYQEAVVLTRQHFPDSPDLPILLNNLGVGLENHYIYTGKPESLERGIEAYQEAVVLTRQHSPDSPDLSILLNNLGVGLENHYTCTGNPDSLERGINATAS